MLPLQSALEWLPIAATHTFFVCSDSLFANLITRQITNTTTSENIPWASTFFGVSTTTFLISSLSGFVILKLEANFVICYQRCSWDKSSIEELQSMHLPLGNAINFTRLFFRLFRRSFQLHRTQIWFDSLNNFLSTSNELMQILRLLKAQKLESVLCEVKCATAALFSIFVFIITARVWMCSVTICAIIL